MLKLPLSTRATELERPAAVPAMSGRVFTAPATAEVDGRTVAEKNELLFTHGVDFDTLPAWQKRGVGLWWERYEKLGTDPRTGATSPASRRRLREFEQLPVGAEYEALVEERVKEAEAASG